MDHLSSASELISTQSEKDLGFTMDEKFDFGEHIKASLAKANKMIAWVSRNVICKDKEVMYGGRGVSFFKNVKFSSQILTLLGRGRAVSKF